MQHALEKRGAGRECRRAGSPSWLVGGGWQCVLCRSGAPLSGSCAPGGQTKKNPAGAGLGGAERSGKGLEGPVLVFGVDGFAYDIGRARAGKEVVVFVGAR